MNFTPMQITVRYPSLLKQVLYPQDDANRMSVSVRSLVRNPRLRLHTLSLKSGLLIGAVLFAACNRTAPTVSGPLPQRGYLWQRDWTGAVNDAVFEAQKRMDGVVVLGAEIGWAGKKPEVVRANINWKTLKSQHVSCSIARPMGTSCRSIRFPIRTLMTEPLYVTWPWRGHGSGKQRDSGSRFPSRFRLTDAALGMTRLENF